MSRPPHLLIFGLGYSAAAVAGRAAEAGYRVTGTSRRGAAPPPGVAVVRPEQAVALLGEATHWLAGAPPDAEGDPILRLLGDAASGCRPDWIGYFSTTGVYGDRDGGSVDETSAPAPTGPRGQRRVAAEGDWAVLAARLRSRCDVLRLAGIYGPGRSVFDALRAGESRRVIAPGHCFGRIHRDDIAGATITAMAGGPARRVLNLSDDEPAESAVVIEEAARLLGVPPPPAVPLAEALPAMSPMGRSFWSENRKVSSRLTQDMLQRQWRYPTYREGLRAILAAGG